MFPKRDKAYILQPRITGNTITAGTGGFITLALPERPGRWVRFRAWVSRRAGRDVGAL